jgi:hypothetical protein
MEVLGEIARSKVVRIALAAILYVVGVACLIYVAVQEYDLPGASANYWLLYVTGVILVVLASLLLPVPTDSSEGPDGGAEYGERCS